MLKRPAVARRGSVAAVLVMTLGGCTSSADEATDPGGEDVVDVESVDALLMAEAELERLVDAGELDGIVRMQPLAGGTAPLGALPGATILGQRPVLSYLTPEGTAEMFEVRVTDPNMGPGPMTCSMVAYDTGTITSCGPANGPPDRHIGFGGAIGGDADALHELVGPPDMTHFIVGVGDQRLAVVTRQGHGLLAVPGPICVDAPTIQSAWRGEEELVVTTNESC